MSEAPKSRVLATGIGLFIVFIALYLLLPSHFYPPDSLQAAVEIQRHVDGSNFFHPAGDRAYDPNFLQPEELFPPPINARYFLEYPTSTFLGRLGESLGYHGLVITPLLAERAFFGALGVLFFFLAIYELRRSLLIATLASLGLGTAAGYWTFSTDLYQSISSAALVALSFYVLVRLSRSPQPISLRKKFLLAAVLGLATLYNILGVLSFFPFALALTFFRPGLKWLQRLREIIVFGVFYSIVIIGVFIIVSIGLGNLSGQLDPFAWVDATGAGSQDVFHVEPLPDMVRAGLGFGKAEVIVPGTIVRNFNAFRQDFEEAPTARKIAIIAFYGVVGLALAAPILFLIARRKYLPSDNRWLYIMLPIWFFLYAAFNWFWLPSDVHYWLVPLMIWWTVVAVALAHIKDSLPNRYLLATRAAGVFIAVVFVINLAVQFWPESHNPNPWLDIANDLSTTPSNALFVSSQHPLAFYIAYFAHRDVLDTGVINLQWNNDQARLESIISGQVARHRADNGTIYLYTSAPDNLDALAKLVGLSGKDELEVVKEYPDLTLYKADYPQGS